MSTDAEVDALRRSIDLVAYIGQHVQLTLRGREARGLCPFHPDQNPSLNVVPAKQIWNCFSCNQHEVHGADVFGFVRSLYGCTFPEAVLKLQNGNGAGEAKPIIRPPLKKRPPRELLVPPEGSMPDMERGDMGKPLKYWTITTLDGRPFMYEARYVTLSGPDKETRPFSYGRYSASDPPRWECRWPERDRPFYGLDQLGARPNDQVMIHEAAGKAEAAAVLFPRLVHMGLVQGANGVQSMDYSIFTGRRLVLLPDNDEAGKQAMMRVAQLALAAGAIEVKGIDPSTQPDGSPSPIGWDIKDATDWTPAIALAWAKARKTDYAAPRASPSVASAAHAEPAGAAPDAAPEPGPVNPSVAPATPELAQEAASDKPERAQSDLQPVTEAPAPSKPALRVVDGNAVRKPKQEPEPEPEQLPAFSEFALATAFAESAGKDWRYTAAWLEWAKWNGARWVPDEVKRITWELRDCCTAVMNSHLHDSTPLQRMRLTTLKTVNAVMALAGSDPRIAVAPSQWDADPMLLGTPAGVVDLSTGLMLSADQAQMISRSTSIAPAAGEHPWWDRVLERAGAGMGEFLQLWCGYMLTGDTREERFLFIHGPGGGGKSKFLLVLSDILGDYRRTTKMESFTAQQRQEHSEEIARLAGARLVIATETDEGSRWNEARIKALTGRDAIAARHMHKSTFEFKPQFKLVFVGNHRPALRSVGEEMRRRIDLIEWGATIPEAERILDLPDKLQAEYPAILAWMIEGCLRWQQKGLGKPQSVALNVAEYIQGEDTLGSWCEEATQMKQGERTRTSAAYANFKRWTESRGEYVLTQKRFTQALKDRGFAIIKSMGFPNFVDMQLKSTDSSDPDDYIPESAAWTPPER